VGARPGKAEAKQSSAADQARSTTRVKRWVLYLQRFEQQSSAFSSGSLKGSVNYPANYLQKYPGLNPLVTNVPNRMCVFFLKIGSEIPERVFQSPDAIASRSGICTWLWILSRWSFKLFPTRSAAVRELHGFQKSEIGI